MRWLDEVAAGLAELRDAGVVVLWRPLHESNEPAFWWGANMPNSPKPEQVVALWRHMFDYFTHEKGLNNLLWVFSATPMEKPGTLPELLCYPGEAYVDVVGVDLYADRPVISAYPAMTALGKPFALTEFGPSLETAEAGTYDYGQLIQQIQAEYPRTTFVQAWSGSSKSRRAWAFAAHRNAKAFLEHPWTATIEDVDWRPRRPFWRWW